MSAGQRRYSSALREDQARATRARIVDAARELFLARGYAGTTLDAVAVAAGVSLQTVYNAVGVKAHVLKAVYDVTLAGDDEPVPWSQRPAFTAMLAETDARKVLAQYAAFGRLIAERVVPILAVVAEAAGADADLRAFRDTIERERAVGTTNVVALVSGLAPLRTGLSREAAADVLWTLTAPEIVERLVVRRGWEWDRFERWLAQTMVDSLLGATSQGASSRDGRPGHRPERRPG